MLSRNLPSTKEGKVESLKLLDLGRSAATTFDHQRGNIFCAQRAKTTMAPSTKLASSLYSGIFDDGDDGASKEATSSAISETKASTDAGEQPKGDEHEDQPKDAGPEATAPTPKSQGSPHG